MRTTTSPTWEVPRVRVLEHGATVEIQDLEGRMPLWHAVREGQSNTVKLLLEHGADPSCEVEEGCTI